MNEDYQYARKWADELLAIEARRRAPVEGPVSQVIGQLLWSGLIIGVLWFITAVL